MSTQTQCMQILKHIRRHGSITRLESLRLYGCMNLPGRAYDLRGMGFPVKGTLVCKGGKKFARYSLQ